MPNVKTIMEYETFKTKGTPTRTDHLLICDKCEKARWTMYIHGHIYHCTRCGSRMREGTELEYRFAKNTLKLII